MTAARVEPAGGRVNGREGCINDDEDRVSNRVERIGGREELADERTYGGGGRVSVGWRLAVYLNDEPMPVEADPAPLFEAVGALMKLFEAARVVVESRVKSPYGVEAAGLHIDMAHGLAAEYVIKAREGGDPREDSILAGAGRGEFWGR